MNFDQLINYSKKPKIYTPGTKQMWTDAHISKQLLSVHLNSDVDLASRKPAVIQKTINWILEKSGNENMKILDLGCGPGLYTEIFARKGHEITGIDFSKSSINFARANAARMNLKIEYLNANYLEIDLPANQFDLVTLIYTDFGVLLPEERTKLLEMISMVLKKGGIFIFDVLNDKNPEEKVPTKSWETATSGFWKNNPYLALSDSFYYPENKVILSQHLIIDEQGKTDLYRFWTHLFSQFDLLEILKNYSFTGISFHENVLPESDQWNGKNVTFCRAVKN